MLVRSKLLTLENFSINCYVNKLYGLSFVVSQLGVIPLKTHARLVLITVYLVSYKNTC